MNNKEPDMSRAISLIDSHIHLDDPRLIPDYPEHLKEARALGITAWVLPSTTAASFSDVLAIAAADTSVYPALGLHPYFMETHTDHDLKQLETALKTHAGKLVAIGECGLDLMIENPQFERQERLFKAHVRLAREFDLPLIIHSRKSLDLILRELRKERGLRGVIHAFSGSLQQAEQCIELGFKLGFGGAVTYPRTTRLLAILKALPKDSYLLETDAPSMPNAFLPKGAIHTPKDLYTIAQEIATIRESSLEKVAAETTETTQQLFQLERL